MPDFNLTGELSLKIELDMLKPITEKVHSGNGPVSLVRRLSTEDSSAIAIISKNFVGEDGAPLFLCLCSLDGSFLLQIAIS